MRRFFIATNFVETIRPIYYMTKAVGLISFTADFRRASIHRSFKDVLVFVGFMFLNSYLVIRSSVLSDLGNPSYFNSALIEFILNMFLSLQLIALIAIPIVNFIKAYQYDQFIQQIVEVDKGLKRLGHKHDYSAEFFYCTLYLVVSVVLLFGCLSGMVLSNPFQVNFRTGQNIIILVSFIMSNLVYITSTCYCCASLWVVVYRYHKLNVTFRSFFHTKMNSKTKLLPISEHGTIKTVAALYAKLGAAVRMYNKCFFIHIFYVLGSAFGLNLVCFFTMTHVSLAYGGELDQIDPIIISQLFLSAFYLLVILQVIFAGSLLYKKAKQTAVLVHKAVLYNDCSSTVREQLRVFSTQLSHQITKASCYFYDIDWKCLLSMISSFATYLNILVQFDIIQIRTLFSKTNRTLLLFESYGFCVTETFQDMQTNDVTS